MEVVLLEDVKALGKKDLGYTRIHGKTRYNDAKNAEIKDRVSM